MTVATPAATAVDPPRLTPETEAPPEAEPFDPDLPITVALPAADPKLPDLPLTLA